MRIALCTVNETLCGRWREILSGNAVVTEVTTVDSLQKTVNLRQTDLFIIHRDMVSLNNIRQIRAWDTEAKIMVTSDRPSDNEGAEVLRLGAVGYINSYASANRLVKAVRIIEEGGAWVGQSLMQKLIKGIGSAGTSPTGNGALSELSPREKEIALLVAEGYTNKQIGDELYIAERTVKVHLQKIFSKCKAKNRLQLALHVRESGGGDVPTSTLSNSP